MSTDNVASRRAKAEMAAAILTPAAEAPSAAMARGLLGVWHGVESGFEHAFDDWYDRQHHRERVGIPGFLRARRYVNVATGPRYFCRYEVTDAAVLSSAAYLERVNNPTEWTRSMLPRYRDTTRAVFRFAARVGEAEGAHLATLRVPDVRTAEAGWRGSILAALSGLATEPGVLRADLWERELAGSALCSEEKRLRPTADAIVEYALLVEGSDVERLAPALTRRLLPLLPAGTIVDRYRLAFALERE